MSRHEAVLGRKINLPLVNTYQRMDTVAFPCSRSGSPEFQNICLGTLLNYHVVFPAGAEKALEEGEPQVRLGRMLPLLQVGCDSVIARPKQL